MTDSSCSHAYIFSLLLYPTRLSCCIEIFASIPYNNYQVSSRQAVWLRMVWRDWKGRALYWLVGFCQCAQHSLLLTSLLPLTDITLTDSWYHHHHHHHWLFPALSSGLARYVNFNRIIPGITEGMLLQRLSRSCDLLSRASKDNILLRTKKLTSDPLWMS